MMRETEIWERNHETNAGEGEQVRGARKLRRITDRVVRRGPRTVVWTQPTANLGNFLYEWMHAYLARAEGRDVVCLATPAMDPWLAVVGDQARRLVVARGEVHPWDRIDPSQHNEWGVHLGAERVERFVQEFLLPAGVADLASVPAELHPGPDDVVVNVRGGDYLLPQYWSHYGFVLEEYLRAALDEHRRQRPIARILVVSDGITWCAEQLTWLDAYAKRVDLLTTPLPPVVHLAVLARAPRLVLANSTFSYWGGYLSTVLYQRPEQVVAPWFHRRDHHGGAAWQLDPRWSVVDDIPSHWAHPDDVSGD